LGRWTSVDVVVVAVVVDVIVLVVVSEVGVDVVVGVVVVAVGVVDVDAVDFVWTLLTETGNRNYPEKEARWVQDLASARMTRTSANLSCAFQASTKCLSGW
jgi:hypothetical protein